MTYASRCQRVVETLWNSRDGVTPFVVFSRGGTEMTHVNWRRDWRDPGHVPEVGDRIFVDATLADFRVGIRNRIGGYLGRDGKPSGDLAERFPGESADQIVEQIAVSEFGEHEHQPHVEIVTPELCAALRVTQYDRIAEAISKGFEPGKGHRYA